MRNPLSILAFLLVIIAALLIYDYHNKKLTREYIVVTVNLPDMQCTYTQSYEKVLKRIEKAAK